MKDADADAYDESQSDQMIKLFTNAMDEFNYIWRKSKYAGKNVHSESINPDQVEKPFNDYLKIKDLFEKGPKSL
jgi:hypothetical protein